MELAEVVSRLEVKFRTVVENKGIGLVEIPPPPSSDANAKWVQPLPRVFDVAIVADAADRVLHGHFDVFSQRDLTLGFPPFWNCDPKTDIVAPLVFGKTLDYRDESIVGDIKYLWEPNRHLEVVTLAQAYHLTGDVSYAEGCQTLLDSWFEQCPYPMGVNWVSSLEHSIRLLNWSYAWHLLGGEESPLFKGNVGQQFRRRWLDSVYQHCHFISGHFSLYSSANNHLLGEYMGLYVASATWPLWKESEKWHRLGKQGFEQEALKQNTPDGVNREQGIWYHHEVADMMLLCGLIGRANDDDFSTEYWSRLEVMLEYIASIMDVCGNVPMFGDSDDAVMVRFSQEPDFNVYRSLLATGAVLFNRADFKRKAGHFDDKSRWLLGDEGEKRFNEISVSSDNLPVKYSFPEGGYYILGDGFETNREIRIVADSGPLGYLSIAAHGHADALSFVMTIAGQEILIDPGTYAYHTQKKWRDYFRGTSAHNTVMVDGQDQSVSGGNFLWLKHAKARCLEFSRLDDCDVWVGEHNGYHRLKDKVNHQRMLKFEKNINRLTVLDSLACKGSHYVDLHWHFAERCEVDVQNRSVVVRNDGVIVTMTMPDCALEVSAIRGQEEPPLGWVSRRFDEKQPVTTVRWSGEISGSSSLTTVFQIGFDQERGASED